MTNQGDQQPEIKSILFTILLISLALVLPGLEWSLFGWLFLLLPLIVFFLFGRFGNFTGKRLLLTGAAISLVVDLLAGNFELFLFSSVMLAPGFVLYQSAKRGDTPYLSGLKGFLALAGGWFIAIAVTAIGSEISIYSQTLLSLDQAITAALGEYRQYDGITPETLAVVETALSQMKVVIPLIMPGILGSIGLFITWITMVLGNVLLERTTGFKAWPIFRDWTLPEKLIWAVIAMAACILIRIEPLPTIGINCVILLVILYCFQGLSVTVFFMNKWKVPLLLRSFFYVMIVFQSLGTLVLLFFGIADIWVDFRKLKTPDTTENK